MNNDDPSELLSHSRNLALRLVADPSVADDLAQEAWLVLRKRGEVGVGDLNAYLAGVVRNLSRRWLRTTATRVRHERQVASSEALNAIPGELDTTLDMHRDLLELVRALPVPLREAIQLRFYEGLPAAEVARRLGIPATTIRSRISRALAELRIALDLRHQGGRGVWATLLMGLPIQEEAGIGAGGTSWGILGAGLVVVTLLVSTAVIAPSFLPANEVEPEHPVANHVLPSDPTDTLPASHTPVLTDVIPAGAASVVSKRRVLAADTEATSAAPIKIPFRTVRVLDRTTGMALPEYRVNITGKDWVTRYAITDEKGEFRLEDSTARWEYKLAAIDHGKLGIENPETWDMGAAALAKQEGTIDFLVDVGPTFHLQLPTDAPDGLTMQLDKEGRDYSIASINPRDPELLGASLSRIGFNSRGAESNRNLVSVVRGDSAPFVRFAPGINYEEVLGPRPWYLRLDDGNGLWQAWAQVYSVHGVHPGRIAFEGGAFGRVRVHAKYPKESTTGPSFRSGTLATLVDAEGKNAGSALRYLSNSTRPKAAWDFLAPGRYTLRIGGDIHEQQIHELLVQAGETTHLGVKLKRRTGGRDISVILNSESGTIDFSRAWISLRPAETSQGSSRSQSPVKSDSPADHSGFLCLFENMAPGPWKLDLRHTSHLPGFNTANDQVIGADETELRLTCLDKDMRPMVTPSVVIIDAFTGDPVERAGISLWVRGEMYGTSYTVSLSNARATMLAPRSMRSLPRGTPFSCAISAPGYQPLLLSNEKYPPELPGGEVGEFRLQPGWGGVIHTVTRKLAAIEGVEVSSNGQVLGKTDSNGLFLFTANGPDSEIRVHHPEFKYFGGSLDPHTGRPIDTQGRGLITVLMESR